MPREAFPSDYEESEEPSLEGLRGFSQAEGDAMNRGQTFTEAEAEGKQRGETLAREEEMRQRLGHDGQKDQAHLLAAVQEERRQRRR